MKKILFFISQDMYVKHYLTFDSFKLIEKKYNCSFLASKDVKIFKDLIERKKNFLGFITRNDKKDRFSRILSDALLIANSHKSSSFPLRIIMRFNLNFRNILRKPLWKTPFRILIRLFNAFRIFSTRFPVSLIIKNNFILRKLNNYIHTNKNFEKILDEINPDLVIIPTSGQDGQFFQSVVESRKKKIKTFAIIDNWDNISTKSIMPEHPNFIGVWGEQTKDHATKIQNFKNSQCKIVGSARYQDYFNLRNEELKSHFDFEYILFLGTSWNWNEEETIKIIDEFITQNHFLKTKYKIIYRPHPFRQGKTIPVNFKNVIYDPEILKIIEKKTHSHSNLHYYPSLIKNAKFVMGGPQTMMIEATIFNKFYLALTYDDKINYTNMKKVFSSYQHFRGIEKIETIHYCDDLNKLGQEILKMISLNSLDINDIDYQRNFILFKDEKRYDQKILNAVDEILD